MAEPTAQEILEWALINRARLDPAGEAARFHIDLNEGLAPGTITPTSKQPLAFSAALFASADAYSQAMIDGDFFAHVNPNTGSTPQSRGNAAGYSGAIGENIVWSGSTGPIDATGMAISEHQLLFVDTGIADRGHRTNLLDDRYQEVGVGQVLGLFTSGGTTYNASMITEDFGIPSAAGQFLVGLAYNDTDANAFYSVGEGRSAVSVTVGASHATTGTAGAYSMSIASGSQVVSFSGGGLAATVSVSAAIAAGRNALIDLVGTDTVETSVSIIAGAGVTKIIGLGNLGLTLVGNGSDNTIVSALGNDSLDGGAGFDTAVFSGNRANYTIVTDSGGTTTVTGPSGTDTVVHTEKLQFDDASVLLTAAASTIFEQPTVKLAAFNPANGWTSQDQFHRELADVNGDGMADIVAFGNPGVLVSLATGNGNFAAPTVKLAAFNPANGWTNDDTFHRELADVNGDHLADIIGFGNAGVSVSLATGGGNFAAPTVTFAGFNPANGWTSQDQFHREMADVNGDGMADIVGFGNGGVLVSLATGGGNFSALSLKLAAFNPANGWTSQDQFHRELADVNGDGMADIVAFGNPGVLVSLATGGGNFATPTVELAAFNPANGWTSEHQFPRQLADVNGDGMADIVGFGNAGVYVALATGGGHFAAPIVDIPAFNPANGWTGDDQFHRELADVNHDGSADIVGFGIPGVLVALSNDFHLI